MEEKISLKEIFDILRKHIATVLMSMFIGLALAGVVTFFLITPKYSSRAQLIVSLPQAETSNVNDISFNLQMLNTYKDIILEGDAQAQEVQARLKNDYNIKMTLIEIKESLKVVQAQDSQMFSIQATDASAKNAETIANVTAEVFQETAQDILTNVDKITIVSSAVASSKPVSPNNKMNLAMGFAIGLIVGLLSSLLMELFDRTVKDPRFVAETLDLTILGTVPEMSAKELSSAMLPKNVKLNSKKTQVKHEQPMRRSRAKV